LLFSLMIPFLPLEIQQLRGVPSLRTLFVIRYRVELDLPT